MQWSLRMTSRRSTFRKMARRSAITPHSLRREPTQILFRCFRPESIAIRTYERGVEGETLACGTGVCAAALLHHLRTRSPSPVHVKVRGGDTLQVAFEASRKRFPQCHAYRSGGFCFRRDDFAVVLDVPCHLPAHIPPLSHRFATALSIARRFANSLKLRLREAWRGLFPWAPRGSLPPSPTRNTPK